MTSFYNLLKYAATGHASPDMTYYDKLRASTLMGGAVHTLTGQPPLSFKADGTPLISWSMKGNGEQSGTPSPDNPVMPTFCGVRTANLAPPTWASDFLSRVTPQTGFVPRIQDDYLLVYARNGYGNYDTEYLFTTEWKQNTQYTFCITYLRESNQNTDSMLAVAYTDETTEYFPATVNDGEWHTIYVTTTANKTIKYLRIRYSTGSLKIKIDNFYVYEGIEQKPYEPFGWAEKITCGGETTTVYLGQVSTVRRIRKLVVTGDENFTEMASGLYRITVNGYMRSANTLIGMCSHFGGGYTVSAAPPTKQDTLSFLVSASGNNFVYFSPSQYLTAADFKQYLAEEYSAGHPVTIWYVLAEPTTGIVNEPLAKIGDYCDELNSEDAGVSIPTAKGANTLTVGGDLQPSEMTITYRG